MPASIGYPNIKKVRQKTPEINRSRAVHIPRYSQKKLTPKTQKVTVIQSWQKLRLFFKEKIWLISRFARSDNQCCLPD